MDNQQNMNGIELTDDQPEEVSGGFLKEKRCILSQAEQNALSAASGTLLP